MLAYWPVGHLLLLEILLGFLHFGGDLELSGVEVSGLTFAFQDGFRDLPRHNKQPFGPLLIDLL